MSVKMRFVFCKHCEHNSWTRRQMFLWRCIKCGRPSNGPRQPLRLDDQPAESLSPSG